MALSIICQEALWLRHLAKEIDPDALFEAMPIYCDNKRAVDLVQCQADKKPNILTYATILFENGDIYRK